MIDGVFAINYPPSVGKDKSPDRGGAAAALAVDLTRTTTHRCVLPEVRTWEGLINLGNHGMGRTIGWTEGRLRDRWRSRLLLLLWHYN
jgi:hypothetical protein